MINRYLFSIILFGVFAINGMAINKEEERKKFIKQEILRLESTIHEFSKMSNADFNKTICKASGKEAETEGSIPKRVIYIGRLQKEVEKLEFANLD